MKRIIGHRIWILALLLAVVPVVFTACENTRPDINVSFESDARSVRDALQSVSQSLADRMAQLESAMNGGMAAYQAALSQVRQAVDSLGGSLEEKLAAVTEVVKMQGTSLEAKLALIEAAAAAGFADGQAQQALLQEAVAALEGSEEEKLAALETAVKNQSADLVTKLGLIEASVREGLADQSAAQKLLKAAIASLGDTLEAQTAAIDSTLSCRQTALSAKLLLIETAVREGFAGEKTLQVLIAQALDSLGGNQEDQLAALEAAMESRLSGLESKLTLIEASVSKQFADEQAALNLLLSALSSLKGSVDGADAKIDAIMATLGTIDPTTGTVAETLANILTAISGIPDIDAQIAALEQSVELLNLLSIRYEDYVMGDSLVLSIDSTLIIPYTVNTVSDVTVLADATDGISFSVAPDANDARKGKLTVTAAEGSLSSQARLFVTLQGKYKTVKSTLRLVQEQMSAPDQDKTLLYDQTYSETDPLVFRYTTNTPTIVTIEDTLTKRAPTWMRRVYDAPADGAATDSVIKFAVDTNKEFRQRGAIVLVRNRISKHELKFTITQDYYSTVIVFADSGLKDYLVASGKDPVVDINRDKKIEMAEAIAVTSLNTLFDTGSTTGRSYPSFNEFKYFTGITELPAGSFAKWTSLESITLPESITTLEINPEKDAIFQECPKLRSIRGPFTTADSSALIYPQGDEKILVAAVENRESYTIPSGVTTIGHNVFYKNTTLKSVDLNQVSAIRDSAFRASGLTSVTIPDGVNTIGACAFVECASLRSFSGASASGKYWVLPFNKNGDVDDNGTGLCLMNDNAVIAYALASDCKSLNIPVSVTSKNIETISDYAFAGARYLEYLTLQRRIKKMGAYSVYNCPNLKSAHFQKVNEIPAGGVKMFGGTTACKIYVDDSQVDAFKNKDANWKVLGDAGRIEAWGDRISFRDIDMKRYLVALIDTSRDGEISETEAAAVVKFEDLSGGSMSSGAKFKYFDEFQYFTGIKKLPAGSFNDWTELISITLPNSIETIDIDFKDQAGTSPLRALTVFRNCPNLTSIRGGNDFTTDGTILRYKRPGESTYKLVKVVESLTSCTIPEGIDTIARYCFYGSQVKSVKLPASLKTIGECAFEHSAIERVDFPMAADTIRVTTIYDRTFAHCFQLKQFTGNQATAVTKGQLRICADGRLLCRDTTAYAYAMGSSESALIIPEDLPNTSNKIKRLTDCLFDRRDANLSPLSGGGPLKQIALPSAINRIGSHTFYNQKSLELVYFKGSTPPANCGVNAFGLTDNLMFYTPSSNRSGFANALHVPENQFYTIPPSWNPYPNNP